MQEWLKLYNTCYMLADGKSNIFFSEHFYLNFIPLTSQSLRAPWQFVAIKHSSVTKDQARNIPLKTSLAQRILIPNSNSLQEQGAQDWQPHVLTHFLWSAQQNSWFWPSTQCSSREPREATAQVAAGIQDPQEFDHNKNP